jgi:hypothetical protein
MVPLVYSSAFKGRHEGAWPLGMHPRVQRLSSAVRVWILCGDVKRGAVRAYSRLREFSLSELPESKRLSPVIYARAYIHASFGSLKGVNIVSAFLHPLLALISFHSSSLGVGHRDRVLNIG